jgi:hypothetical protein
MVKLIEKLNYFDYTTGEIRKHVNKGEKAMKKRNLQLPPGSLNAHLLRSLFCDIKTKGFEYSTHMKNQRKS